MEHGVQRLQNDENRGRSYPCKLCVSEKQLVHIRLELGEVHTSYATKKIDQGDARRGGRIAKKALFLGSARAKFSTKHLID